MRCQEQVSWPERLIVVADNLVKNLAIVGGLHFGILFSVRHIVSPLWHVCGFSETRFGIRSKFFKYFEKNFVDGDTFGDIS